MLRIYLRIAALPVVVLTIFIIPDLILGLRDVSVTVPTAVKRGDDAHLICNYDMENDTLYSVKWYKGRREFYRYTPKENPAMKIFPTTGVNVQKISSNQSHVMLTNVQLNLSGKFSCEVSADAPSFHTTVVSANMEVVELPEQRPIITGIHLRYRMGDLINGNCSSEFSKPAANLTWTINGIQVMPNQVKHYEVQKNLVDNLEASVAEVSFIVNHLHFIHGRLKLKCSARIHNIYQQETEKNIEEDRPRILASGRSPDNLYPYDQQSDGEFPDPNEYYYKETNSATSSLLINRQQSCIFSSIFSSIIEEVTNSSRTKNSFIKFFFIISLILKNIGILLISVLVSIIFLINNLSNNFSINLLNNNNNILLIKKNKINRFSSNNNNYLVNNYNSFPQNFTIQSKQNHFNFNSSELKGHEEEEQQQQSQHSQVNPSSFENGQTWS